MIVDLSSHLATRTAKWGALQNTRRSFFYFLPLKPRTPCELFPYLLPCKILLRPDSWACSGRVVLSFLKFHVQKKIRMIKSRGRKAGREYSNRGQVSNDPISISRNTRVSISAFWTTTTRPGKHVLAPTAVFSRSRSAVLADLPRVRLVLYCLHRGESLARMVRISSGLP